MAYLILWIICIAITMGVASSKNQSQVVWFAIGFLSGPFGIIFALLAEDKSAE